jgi:hypothetical protein
LTHLLCVNGTGMGWNPDGYICDLGPSGIDDDTFNGYTRCEDDVDPEIRNDILAYRKEMAEHPKVGHKIHLLQASYTDNARRINNGENYFDVLDKRESRSERWKGIKPEIIAECEAEIEAERKASEDRRRARPMIYPMSEGYANLLSMPDNAHESYIRVGKELCELILTGNIQVYYNDTPKQTESEVKRLQTIAKKWLKKWKL